LHTIKRVHDHYFCTCYAWRQQRNAVDARTCKHLAEYLGAAYEGVRVGGVGGDDKADDDGGVVRAAPSGAGAAAGDDTRYPAPKVWAWRSTTALISRMPQVMLAHKWDDNKDPAGFWMSEKLDGVRAWWNGSVFISRNGERRYLHASACHALIAGNQFFAPPWFKSTLSPSLVLDGELFSGRGQFQNAVSIARTRDDKRWKELSVRTIRTW
jgi:DNA ligase-1